MWCLASWRAYLGLTIFEHIWEFTIRSTYRLILQATINPTSEESSSTSTIAHFRTHLWELCNAPKVKIFLWRLYNNILPTQKNLSRRITSIQSCCAIFWECGRCFAWLLSMSDYDINLVELELFTLGGGFFQILVTPQAILEWMLDWLAYDSSRFAYFYGVF